jgi:hypothetical protein
MPGSAKTWQEPYKISPNPTEEVLSLSGRYP